jgi:NADPH:quinone reductase-like Zn-dependent oxidoreductase
MSLIRKILGVFVVVVAVGLAVLAIALSHNAPCGSTPAAPALPMRAAVNRCYGTPDVIRVEPTARPVPAEHDLLVQVHAASVNPLDWHYLLGEPYLVRLSSGWGSPKDVYLGTDFAGTVVAVGRLVTKFKPGDAVFGGGDGAFAQYLRIADDGAVALKPATVSFEAAAAVPVAGITALQALRDTARLRPGQKVLVNGAGGGVGTFAVQVAKALGADVTGVTNTGSVALVRSLGADRVLDYTQEDFTQGAERYDVILDMSGNHSLGDYRRVLTPNGVYVLAGDTSRGAWLGPLAGFGKTVIAAWFVKQKLQPFMANLTQADLATLAEMLETGKIRPVIDRRFDLEHVADAFRYQLTGHARGKVIVTVE